MCRLLIVILGALPASVLASFAVGVVSGGVRSLASAEPTGALFVAWGILGIAGTAGLWLAVMEGPVIEGSLPRIAAVLIGCGLVADAVLIGVPLVGGALSVPFWLDLHDLIYWGLAVPPFLVGAMYVGLIVFHDRRLALEAPLSGEPRGRAGFARHSAPTHPIVAWKFGCAPPAPLMVSVIRLLRRLLRLNASRGDGQ